MWGQDFILYCNTAEVINAVLCILPELNKLHFPNLQKKDAGTSWHEKLFVRSVTTFHPLELDTKKQTPELKSSSPSLHLSLIFLL